MAKKKNIEEDFFGDMLNNEDEENKIEESNEIEDTEVTHFSFEDDVPEELPVYKEDNYNRNKTDIKESVAELQGNINSMLDQINVKPEDMFPDKDLLPGLDIQVEYHDYEKDIELIKIESKETLECLANLYLSEEQMKTKNIYKIIKDDSTSLTDLSFSISCSKRALVNCMKQLDMGVNDPDMYQSVAIFQKELRDTVKMAYDLQKKMKDFYKELKTELQEINAGEEEIITPDDNYTVIGDPKMLNDLIEKMKTDPTLLQGMLDEQKKTKK
jgi:hypothetical protein